MSKETQGTELMRKIQSGEIRKVSSDYVHVVRNSVSEALEELLDFGGRVRPLILEGKRVGWIRGVHLSERKLLQRWSMDITEFAEHIVKTGTTLSQEFVEGLSGSEIQGLIRLIKEMSDYDLTLFPFLYAFSTTSVSNRLWCGRGTSLSNFQNHSLALPDGANMKVLVPSDHARFWAALCVQHDQQMQRVEASMNAALIIRPWVGKGGDGLNAELRNSAKSLQLDNVEPWTAVVRLEKSVDIDDGWAHADDSVEGLQRELKGMMNNDRHEQLIAAFEEQQRQQADDHKEKFNKLVAERGGPGIVNEKVEIHTDADIRKRAAELKKGKPSVASRAKRDQGDSPADPKERIKKYK